MHTGGLKLKQMRAWALLTRPVFLLGGALLYALGTVMALSSGAAFNLPRYLLGQLVVTSIQLAAQYINEYYDVETDRLNAAGRTWFSGGSGILPTGAIPVEQVFNLARFFFALGLAGMLAVIIQVPLVALIGVLAWYGARAYSSPPLSLMRTGWGELAASLIVGLLVPLTGFGLQAGRIDAWAMLVCSPLVLLHLAMLITLSMPDLDPDARAGKRTLVVRLGLAPAAYLANALILLAGLLFIAFSFQLRTPMRYLWVAAPLALAQVWGNDAFAHGRRRNIHRLTLGAVALFACTSLLLLLGFL